MGAHLELLEVDGAVAVDVVDLEQLARHELRSLAESAERMFSR